MNDAPARDVRFMCDAMLARLARWLRAAGYDAELGAGGADRDLVERCRAEARVLLTRDRHLTRNPGGPLQFLLLPHEGPDEHAMALSSAFGVDWMRDPFSRCLVDNTPLRNADEAEVAAAPAEARSLGGPFRACPCCRRVYWPGGHVRRMTARLERWRDMAGGIGLRAD